MTNKMYESLYGTWTVTTEGDEEGRTVQNLGVFEGWLDEIAFHLAEKCYYSLKFKRVEPRNINYRVTKKEVSVGFDIESGTWDMTPQARADMVQAMFNQQERSVRVKAGGGYAGFTLVSTQETQAERVARLREEAAGRLRSTMSPDDLKLLGLA